MASGRVRDRVASDRRVPPSPGDLARPRCRGERAGSLTHACSSRLNPYRVTWLALPRMASTSGSSLWSTRRFAASSGLTSGFFRGAIVVGRDARKPSLTGAHQPRSGLSTCRGISSAKKVVRSSRGNPRWVPAVRSADDLARGEFLERRVCERAVARKKCDFPRRCAITRQRAITRRRVRVSDDTRGGGRVAGVNEDVACIENRQVTVRRSSAELGSGPTPASLSHRFRVKRVPVP